MEHYVVVNCLSKGYLYRPHLLPESDPIKISEVCNALLLVRMMILLPKIHTKILNFSGGDLAGPR